MCGICAVVGSDNITDQLVQGLKKLVYRGYDSCGVYIHNKNNKNQINKNIGEVEKVAQIENFYNLSGNVGLSHTRWATHGSVSKKNSHPFQSNSGKFIVVHNGIISNYLNHKESLINKGYKFESETDSEVFVNLLDCNYLKSKSVESAIKQTISQISGSYAFVIFCLDEPEKLFGIKFDAPLIIGVGNHKNFLASDINAFIDYTKNAVILDNNDLVILEKDKYTIKNIINDSFVQGEKLFIDWNADIAKKGGFEHFMLKEIFEQPDTVNITMSIKDDEVFKVAENILSKKHTYLLGVGTTYYVAMFGSYIFSKIAQVRANAYSTDECDSFIMFDDKCYSLFISQSGETFDTRQALEMAKKDGSMTGAIVNVIGSSISRISDDCILQGSGPEISVVSTKSALSQMLVLHKIALAMALQQKILKSLEYDAKINEIKSLSNILNDLINENSGLIQDIAQTYIQKNLIKNWLFLGKNIYYPIAMESALKMKEVTYLHAEGLPAGFLKHGTLAMIDSSMASFFFLPGSRNKDLYESSMHSVEEVKARGGITLGFAYENDERAAKIFNDFIPIPDLDLYLNPYTEMVMAQLFSYYAALILERNIDMPRNLAKSVTVP